MLHQKPWGLRAKYIQPACKANMSAIHQDFYTYKKIEINRKSYVWFWKKSEGNIFPGRRFKFHSWEHLCDQSQGIENIMRRETSAGSLYSFNLLSCQLSDVDLSEFPFAPFSMRGRFFFTQLLPFCCSWYFRLGDLFQQEMVQQYFYTGVEVTQKRLTVAPVSAGRAVCLQWEWKQPVIHD